MNVLVTGAAGFIGSHVVERYLAAGWHVVGLDNFDGFYGRRVKEGNLEQARRSHGFELVEGDIRDGGLLGRLFGERGPFDAVVHLAARAGVRASITDAIGYAEVNVLGTAVLLNEAIRQQPAPRLIFASSSSVYGERDEVPFRESDATAAPASPYAATKLSGEMLCRASHHVHGLPVFCLRLFTVYGPRQRPDLAIHKFARLLLAGEPLPVFGGGESSRDYTYIDDVTAGIARAVECCHGFEVINLGSGHPVSLTEMIAAVARACGQPPRMVRLPPQVGDVTRTFADITKAERLLGYRVSTRLDEGLRRQISWLRQTAGPRAA